MMEKMVVFLIMHSSLPQLFSPTPEKVLHTIKSEKTWLLPLLEDPEKNRLLIFSRCSRDTEAYAKIGKNLEDVENRELREQLSKARKEAEKQTQPASVALSDSAKVAWPDSKSGSTSSKNLLCNFAEETNDLKNSLCSFSPFG